MYHTGMFRSVQQMTFLHLRIWICFFSLLRVSAQAMSQDSAWRKIVLEVKPVWGFIAPHHDYMGYFLEKNVTGFQLDAGFKTDGSRCWHHHYNFPVTGVGIYHSSLGNDKIYGTLTGMYFYINRDFTRSPGPVHFGNAIAFGLGYASKWHHPRNNPLNQVLATPINVFLQYHLQLSVKLGSHAFASCSAGLTHTSNGNFREPNKGFNIVTTTLGIQYDAFRNERFPDRRKIIPCDSVSGILSLGVFSGTKAISRFNNSVYPVWGISAEQLFRLGALTMLGTELVVYRDWSAFDQVPPETLNSKKESDAWFAVLSASLLLQMGRLAFAFQPGIYLKNSVPGNGVMSDKIGLRYQLTGHWMASVSIKAHWLAKADFVEWAVRYTLKKW